MGKAKQSRKSPRMVFFSQVFSIVKQVRTWIEANTNFFISAEIKGSNIEDLLWARKSQITRNKILGNRCIVLSCENKSRSFGMQGKDSSYILASWLSEMR